MKVNPTYWRCLPTFPKPIKAPGLLRCGSTAGPKIHLHVGEIFSDL